MACLRIRLIPQEISAAVPPRSEVGEDDVGRRSTSERRGSICNLARCLRSPEMSSGVEKAKSTVERCSSNDVGEWVGGSYRHESRKEEFGDMGL